jgi:hypothetical protein
MRQALQLALRNFPVRHVTPRAGPQPDGSGGSEFFFLRGDALKDNPFSLRVNKVLSRHNESVASYAFPSFLQTRSSCNPVGIIIITTFENIVGRLRFAPSAERV